MNYLYSQINRLEEPHNYMYTPFQGEAFLQSYQSSRMAAMHRHVAAEHDTEPDHMLMTFALPALEKLFDTASHGSGKKFRALLESGSAISERRDGDDYPDDLAKSLDTLATSAPVTTSDLLHALIAVQLTDIQSANAKIWLDRLIQRFEVTKILYERYPAGFRKGEGVKTSVRLYWLFALALCLFYARSNGLKYLSVLLKVCDLLCSLPENVLRGHIPEHGLSSVLAAEIVSVQLLAEKKGVSFAPE